MISIADFSQVEMRIGVILSAERVPETDKLLKLTVDFGEQEPRQVVSGIAQYVPDLATLIGKRTPFVTNLEPRTIKGLLSQAMIVAVHAEGDVFSFLEPTGSLIPPGTKLN
jgi:methionyl-tRNA synthetase